MTANRFRTLALARVTLGSVDEETLGEAMTLAWQNTARKKLS